MKRSKPDSSRQSRAQSDRKPQDLGQTITADNHSTIKNVIQAIVHLGIPLPAAIVLAVAIVIAILGAAGLFNISELRSFIPPFAAAKPGETLIIVAAFENRSEGQRNGDDPSSAIYDFIRKAEKDTRKSSTVRIEWLSKSIADEMTAQSIGRQYHASMVIWGRYNKEGMQPSIEIIGDRSIVSTPIALDTTKPMSFYVLYDVPAQSAYLGLFSLD